ncbi:MAG: hypothetical protein AAFN92_11630, partial [Bacteroidota bacterium]
MQDNVQYIKQEDDEIIGAWVKSYARAEHSAYHPHNFLFFVRRGNLHFRVGDEELTFVAPANFLIRKNTLGYYRKSWREEEGYAETYILGLKEELVQSVIAD